MKAQKHPYSARPITSTNLEEPTLKAVFLIPNQAWVVLFGDSILDLDGERFFSELSELEEQLGFKGLTLAGKARKVSLV